MAKLRFLVHVRIVSYRDIAEDEQACRVWPKFRLISKFKQESRADARKPRDAASVLFSRSSPTTFLTSIRLARLRKPRFRAPNMLAQNTI